MTRHLKARVIIIYEPWSRDGLTGKLYEGWLVAAWVYAKCLVKYYLSILMAPSCSMISWPSLLKT